MAIPFNLPTFEEDPYYGKTQEELFPVGRDILRGDIPPYLAPIGEIGGPAFEDLMRLTTRDITQRGLETAARMKIKGPRAGVGISKAIADIAPKMRYEDLVRALKGRERLFGRGVDIMTGVRGAGLSLTGMKSQFALGRAGLDLKRIMAERQEKAEKEQMWADIISSVITGGATMAGFAMGGPAGGAVASKLGSAAVGGGDLSELTKLTYPGY